MAAGNIMDELIGKSRTMNTKLPPTMIETPPELQADLPRPSAQREEWTVFLVEDDHDDVQLALRILKQSPRIHKIVCVQDGISLFSELENNHFYNDEPVRRRGVILLDIHMPGIDGIQLLEQIRSNPFTESLPIVMITGDSEQRKVHKSYMLNANAFISKPFTEEHLENIHAVFDSGSGWNESSH